MNTIAVTMAFNEGTMLRRWLRHYGKHLGAKHLLVIDHGSDDGSTENIEPASRIRLPRTPFDDGERADFVSELVSNLMRYYDAAIYTDTDEFLVADPERFANLAEYIQHLDSDSVRATGYEVFHHLGSEEPLQPDLPILAQRGFAQFSSAYCKPLVHKSPVRWRPGFHACNKPAQADPKLLLFHLRSVDRQDMLDRLQRNRAIEWSSSSIDAGWSKHMRVEDETAVKSRLLLPIERIRKQGGPTLFDPVREAANYNARIKQAGEAWRVHPGYSGDVCEIPKRFGDVF